MVRSLATFFASLMNLNFFHWLTLATLIIMLSHFLYGKAVKPLMLKVGVKSKHISPMVESIWQLGFLFISLPMTYVCLESNILSDWVKILDNELTKCKLHQETTAQGIQSVFITLTAYALTDIKAILIEKGYKNLDFYHRQVFFAIFALTYYSKCARFGLSLYFISNWATVIELVSKMCYFLAKYTKSYTLRTAAYVFCGLSLIVWVYTYLYIYPFFLSNNKSVNSAMMKAELNMLIVLDFLTWIYLSVTVINSMFTRLVVSYTLNDPKDRPRNIAYFLFGCDPLIFWITKTQKSSLQSDSEIFGGNLMQRNMRLLRATVTIRTSIARKVKRIREEKARRMSMQDRDSITRSSLTNKQPRTRSRSSSPQAGSNQN